MTSSVRLAIDAMGGDYGPRVTVPAAADFLSRNPSVRISLFGDEAQIHACLKKLSSPCERLSVVHCEQQVDNDEKPSQALRQKRDSSMWRAISAVEQGDADACISAGNTGALMAMGLIQLRLYPGIERPAICAALPALKRRTYLLDAGANLDCTPQQLHQFAAMASCLVRTLDSIDSPQVGLLNVGSEDQKGAQCVRDAAELLAEDGAINYQGFVEGDDVYKGTTDIVVCDGFNGNVALKAGEGVARMIAERLRAAFKRTWYTRLVGALAKPVLLHFRNSIDPAQYNGASFLGLRGIVVKSHGSACQLAFAQALQVAFEEAQAGLSRQIEQAFASASEDDGNPATD
ncbi:phosphate acyltransferase PlsX [Porticoccus sp. W117]|uniref:phosphate acyltransferase PlsX n=1 Tax=Porticoccus sp. W117 TaxID=3054777 RepID=UPI00259312EA|nr:phosphate acyltransferase PlsX [Porticoccus sp. W117]MDM3872141.1 phosphate acyltransferase PlsX [Porticoccus sp. W117]